MNETLDLTNLSESELLSVVTRILARPGDDFTEAELDELTAINRELHIRNSPHLRHHGALTMLPIVVAAKRAELENKAALSEIGKRAAKARWAKAAKAKRQLTERPRLIARRRNN